MTGRVLRAAATTAYAGLVVGAAVAPALALDAATARGGAARAAGLDLILVGVAVGAAYAGFLVRELRKPAGDERELDRWLAGAHGLVVLGITASVLPAVVLHETAVLHADVVDAEWPVLLGWAGLLLVAVGCSDIVRRASLRWLVAGHAEDGERVAGARPDRHVRKRELRG